MDFDTYVVLLGSLIVEGRDCHHTLPGVRLEELHQLYRSGGRYDEVDLMYVNAETQGGD